MSNKIMKNILFIISTFALPLLILLTSTELIAFDVSYYKNQYRKYNIAEKLVIEEMDLLDSTEKLLDYLKDERKDLDFKTTINGHEQEFFSSRDKLHMIDVKNLFMIGRKIRNIILIFLLLEMLVLAYNKNMRFDTGDFFLSSSVIGISPIILLVILINIDFYKYFTIFHEIFFNNDLWLLDPNTDRLVNIFPESFFSDIALKIITYYLTVQVILFILALVLKYRGKHVNAR